MVRPAGFAYNPQTAASNAFQSNTPSELESELEKCVAARAAPGAAQELALREFDGLAEKLTRAGVEVTVAEDTMSPLKPDAIFPNNWVSFHRDGTVVLYPMLAPNRRAERREDVVQQVTREGGYGVSRTVDLTHRENQAQFLEGTGSMVLDRANRLAYAALSPRTDLDVLGEFAQQLDYELVTFEAFDARGQTDLPHQCIDGDRGALRGGVRRVIADLKHRARGSGEVARHRPPSDRDFGIKCRQFAGNLLELAPAAGNVIAMSTAAWRSFDPVQNAGFSKGHGSVVTADIPVIERLGGGGVRCMLAEIHLPKR
jgi:hypothetical protein